MKLPGLSLLKDKWVLIGLAAGAGIYLYTKGGHMAYAGRAMAPVHRPKPTSTMYFPNYDHAGLYQGGAQGDWNHMRFSGQAELQRRLTIT